MDSIKVCKFCNNPSTETGYCEQHNNEIAAGRETLGLTRSGVRVAPEQKMQSDWMMWYSIASGVIALIGIIVGANNYDIAKEIDEPTAMMSLLSTLVYTMASALLVLGVGKIISLMESKQK